MIIKALLGMHPLLGRSQNIIRDTVLARSKCSSWNKSYIQRGKHGERLAVKKWPLKSNYIGGDRLS